MADGNNPNQKNDGSKPGLSWTQPAQGGNTQHNANKPVSTTTKPASSTASSNAAAASDATDSTARVIGIIIGIVVVFALAAWGIVALHNRSVNNSEEAANAGTSSTTDETITDTDTGTAVAPTPVAPTAPVAPAAGGATPTAAPTPQAMTSGASFSVPSPQTAGSSVTVENLSLSAPTWIIVYDSISGTPGRVLGATLLFPADKSGTVELARSTVAGSNYLVTAAVDNGDKTFSVHGEKPIADANGSQMWIKLQTR
jgi:hypothetical protein